jgi:hypothetical protein
MAEDHCGKRIYGVHSYGNLRLKIQLDIGVVIYFQFVMLFFTVLLRDV